MMDYREFRAYRDEQLLKGSEFTDAGDLDLYGKFPPLETIFANSTGGHIGDDIHRCHLVEDFLKVYGLDGSENITADKKLISYSLGVRQSLDILMGLYQDKKWMIASDNYPYYQSLADSRSVDYKLFNTLGYEGFGGLKEISADEDILLVTYPLKPAGKGYTGTDWRIIRNWLSVNTERRVIFDAVYIFELSAQEELFKLFNETKQVIVLYSLSKAFAAPMTAGFTFSFDGAVRDAFKGIPRDEKFNAGMRLCYFLLNTREGVNRREEIRGLLKNKKASAIASGILPESCDEEGYLFYIGNENFEGLLEKGILTVPPSVYSSKAEGVIISTLSL